MTVDGEWIGQKIYDINQGWQTFPKLYPMLSTVYVYYFLFNNTR